MDYTQKMVASLWRNALVWCLIVYTLPGYSYYLQSTQRWIRGYWPEAKRWKHFALAKQGSSSQKTCMHLLCSANATRFFAFYLILWQTHDYNLFRAVSQLSTDLVEVELRPSSVKVDRKVLCSVTCKEAPVCKRWGFWVGFWSEMNMEPYHKWLTMVQSLLCKFFGGQVLDSIVPKINIRGAKQSSISSEKVPILSCLTIVVPTKVKSWGNRRGRPLWSQIGKTEHLETYWKSWSGSLIRSLSVAVIKAAQ